MEKDQNACFTASDSAIAVAGNLRANLSCSLPRFVFSSFFGSTTTTLCSRHNSQLCVQHCL